MDVVEGAGLPRGDAGEHRKHGSRNAATQVRARNGNKSANIQQSVVVVFAVTSCLLRVPPEGAPEDP